MQAEQLRIGNYVWENYGGVYLVRGIPDDKTVIISKTKTTIPVPFDQNDISPIKITEEWLMKLGFEKGSDIMGDCYFIEDATYDIDFALHQVGNVFKCYSAREIEIVYVHRLQNLFESLTGLELELR